jgi:hypothetical protein
MAHDQKLSNPKDSFGSAKLDLGNVPYTLMISAAMAFLEGALKYGRFNWRIAGVRASIYHAALLRHVAKWWNGQDRDKATKVHHLDNAIACLTIIRDAELYQMLTDDRPPCPDPDAMAKLIDDSAATVAHLKDIFKGHDPKQYTIDDTRKKPEQPDNRCCVCFGPATGVRVVPPDSAAYFCDKHGREYKSRGDKVDILGSMRVGDTIHMRDGSLAVLMPVKKDGGL